MIPLDHLVKVNVISETREDLSRFSGWADLQGGAKMNFTEFDLMLLQTGHYICRLLELHGQVTGIIIDSEVLVEAIIPWPILTHLLEEGNGLGRGVEEAERFRLKAKVKGAASFLAQLRDVFQASPK